MAYPPHVLLSWGGTLHGSEIWSNSLRLVGDALNGPSEVEASIEDGLDDVVTDLSAFQNSSLFHTKALLTWVKLNRIGPDGKYANPTTTHLRELATPVPGTGSTCLPPQCSMVATLVTDAQRGLASKGRIFLAGLSAAAANVVVTDGLITTAAATSYRDGVATLLNSLNNWPGIDAFSAGLDVSVVSKGNASNAGIARKVTGVTVGRVVDTQQRRRRDLPEGYLPVAAVS